VASATLWAAQREAEAVVRHLSRLLRPSGESAEIVCAAASAARTTPYARAVRSFDIPEIARRLFGDSSPPPREEYVLGQGFVRKIEQCQNLLPDESMWPPELDGPRKDGGKIRIDRKTVFTVANGVPVPVTEALSAARLHAAIVFWGAPPGRPAKRAVRPLAQATAPHRLTDALNLVRGEGAESAYRALLRGGRLWVNGLGPSYFTKFMYFGGYGAKPYMPQPLIMDDDVIKGLIHVTEQPWEACLDDYRDYLYLAADVADHLSTEPDVIERRLFEIGESL
jgi:hypothetical protein